MLMIPALLGFILWAGSIVDQLLLTTHTQSMDFIANRVTKAIQTDLLRPHPPEALQAMVNDWSSPTLWLWIKEPDGSVMVESKQMAQGISDLRSILMTQSFPLLRPAPYQMADRHLMVKTQMLPMGDKAMGQLYVANDLTALYRQWRKALWGLAIAAFLVIPLLIGAIAIILWRSLRPLRQVNRWATQPNLLPNLLAVSPRQLQQLPQEVQELARSCQQLASRLAQTAEQQQQLTQDISHELRTPLSLVYGYLQSLLRRGNNLTKAQQEALQTAMEEAERMGIVLQDLLEQSRRDRPTPALQPERLNLNQILARIVEWARRIIPDHSLEIRSDLPNLEVNADYTYLTQVLLEVIEFVAQRSQPNSNLTITLKQHQAQAIIELCGEHTSNENHKNTNAEIFLADKNNTFSNSNEHPRKSKTSNQLPLIQSMLRGLGGEISIQTSPNATPSDRFTVQIRLPKS